MKSARVQTSLFLVAVVLATLFAPSEAHPDGAPISACEDATPQHGTSGTPISDSPYNITFDVQEYVRGGEVQVMIEGSSMFKGFLLQARRVSGDTPVGTFTAPDEDIGKLLNCTNSFDSVTHTNNTDKSNLTFTWNAPVAGTGAVRFFGTVVTDFTEFYVGIMSDMLGDSVTDAPTTSGEPTTGMTTNSTEEMTTMDMITMTTANAVKLSTGLGLLHLAAVISVLQLFA